MEKEEWGKALKPLIKKYEKEPHTLEYKSIYQLLVMVLLAAQDSDAHINKLAPDIFRAFPDMKALSKASKSDLEKVMGHVRFFDNKSNWLMDIASVVKEDKNIPKNMKDLVALKGIGRKSANVLLREAGQKAEGIMVDLHVLRVAARLGISKAKDATKMEKEMMQVIPESLWQDVGMAISYLGREVCRPTNPKHSECVMREHCEYYQSLKK